MNRALFSGVSGLKAHQTEMDVIGNNISNVNTYGYKAQRTVFSDVMYQTIQEANSGSASSGGINPSTIGYGTKVAAVQTDTSQASVKTTTNSTDCAITGEGFFQVMDGSGNIYYTKVGSFQTDDNGYLVDSNGNFVLGTSTKGGSPDSQKILATNVGTVDATQSSSTFTLNGKTFTLTAANATKDGDVNFTFASSSSLADGLPAKAEISSTGAVTITFNSNYKYSSMTEINKAINDAINAANGGSALSAGAFTLQCTSTELFPYAQVNGNGTLFGTAASITNGSGCTATGNLSFSATRSGSTWTISATDSATGNVYTATVDSSTTASTLQFKLNGTSTTDCFTMTNPTYTTLEAQNIAAGGTTTTPVTISGGNTATVGQVTRTGAELVGNDFGSVSGTVKIGGGTSGTLFGVSNSTVASVGTSFSASGTLSFSAAKSGSTWTISATDSGTGNVYTATVDSTTTASTVLFKLNGTSTTDCFEMTNPQSSQLDTYSGGTTSIASGGNVATATPTYASKDIGLGAATISLTGGTEGGTIDMSKISVSIGTDGTVYATTDEKGDVEVGAISLANFANPSGLEQVGSSYFKSTANSGDAEVYTPGDGNTGTLETKALEMSNVDLSSEMADMITAQRGFQACARIITVSDSMIEELVNLKRS